MQRRGRNSIAIVQARLLAGAAFLTLALSAIACGDDDDAQSNEGTATPSQSSEDTPNSDPWLVTPCLVVTAEEVSEILGEPYSLVQDSNPCTFIAATGQLSIESTFYGDEAGDLLDLAVETFRGEEATGPAERTLWLAGFRELHMLQDGYLVIIALPPPATETQVAQALAIAEAMAD